MILIPLALASVAGLALGTLAYHHTGRETASTGQRPHAHRSGERPLPRQPGRHRA